ncbi:hypothetical protein [Spiroplasma endosymbiont of 'Nebria riversi']|uniref:hypothetical protein n=1 Tax=Spiroplasma endosymbiont of 'Nebria riversi' TaxID=2792084 RepID=UPI001C0504B9|nr:hypothetical protein [Spiroplasma endosymbiont of 'Nebria riversi']
MWKKSLTILNLVNVMLVSACNHANSKIEKKYNLEFVSLDNTLLIYPYAVENIGNLIFYGGISPLHSNIEERFSNYINFEIEKGVVLDKIVKFYKDNGIYGTYKRFNFDTGYLINKIVNVKFSISFKSTDYYITSFSAEIPNKKLVI